ncbi:hypothetical protein LZ32DRAFT_612017 [Colletotrichum eremochloae]|nr:hypothetical protein LZ32DRAFT_612017 [Colletotrichum eremochloae]
MVSQVLSKPPQSLSEQKESFPVAPAAVQATRTSQLLTNRRVVSSDDVICVAPLSSVKV